MKQEWKGLKSTTKEVHGNKDSFPENFNQNAFILRNSNIITKTFDIIYRPNSAPPAPIFTR